MHRTVRLVLAGLVCASLVRALYLVGDRSDSPEPRPSSAPQLLALDSGAQSIRPLQAVLRLPATGLDESSDVAAASVRLVPEDAESPEAKSLFGPPGWSPDPSSPSPETATEVEPVRLPPVGLAPGELRRLPTVDDTSVAVAPIVPPALSRLPETTEPLDGPSEPEESTDEEGPALGPGPDDAPSGDLPDGHSAPSSTIVPLPVDDEAPTPLQVENGPLPPVTDIPVPDLARPAIRRLPVVEEAPALKETTAPQSKALDDSTSFDPEPGTHRVPTALDPEEASSESGATIFPDAAEEAPSADTGTVPESDAAETPPVSSAHRPDTARSAATAREMQIVSQQAAEHVRRGFSLANRGAYFTARVEFIRALSVISQSLDAGGGRQHGDALAAGLRALEESDDFVPRGTRVEADMDIATIIPAHRTPVLKETPADEVSLLAARQRYTTYAQQQLALAAGHDRSGSMALYGLARVQSALAGREVGAAEVAAPKAMALHQAALLADGDNYMAANELGVMLARYGQLEAARTLLVRSLQSVPQAATWQNLAVVHERLGEKSLAQTAREQAKSLASNSHSGSKTPSDSSGGVVWINPGDFSRMTTADSTAVKTASKSPTSATPPVSRSAAGWFPWSKTSQ